MPLKRTPPSTTKSLKVSDTELIKHTLSESDLSTLIKTDKILNPASNRNNKRARVDASFSPSDVGADSLEEDQNVFATKGDMQEMKCLILALKESQDTILTKLVSEIDAVKKQNQDIKNSNLNIQKTLESLETKNKEITEKISTIENEQASTAVQIEFINDKIKNLETATRSAKIEIRNLPMPENETTNDLISAVTKIGTCMQQIISASDVRDIYRLPIAKKTQDTNDAVRPIVVEFSTVRQMQNLLTAVRTYNRDKPKEEKINTQSIGLKGKKIPIFISEFVSGISRKLFHETRQFSKKHNFLYCWASQGKIFIRKDDKSKIIHIKSMVCLDGLKTIQ